MPAIPETAVETPFLENFLVMGNNWRKEVGVPPDGFELTEILTEAATRAVESFLKGEYETENPDKPVGFGPVIIVRHKKTERSWSLPAPRILANAGAYKDAKDIQDIIDKNK